MWINFNFQNKVDSLSYEIIINYTFGHLLRLILTPFKPILFRLKFKLGWAWPSSAPACSLTNLWFGVCQTYFIPVQANLIQTWVSGWAELDPAQPQLVHWLICGSEFWGNFISKNKMGFLSHKIIINIIDINIVLREGLKKIGIFQKWGEGVQK